MMFYKAYTVIENLCKSILDIFNPHITEKQAGAEKYTSGGKKITLHYADWCTHCVRMKPVFMAVSKTVPGVEFVLVDEAVAKTPGIQGYPTIIKLENGKSTTYSGGPDFNTLRSWIVA
jgi:thiol-disulfide isomerase/thioredoxin